jgi:hypothetical protein
LKQAIAYLFRLRVQITDLRWFASPSRLEMQLLEQESWKLQRFETSQYSRSKFNVHLASARWISDTRIETGGAKDQYR